MQPRPSNKALRELFDGTVCVIAADKKGKGTGYVLAGPTPKIVTACHVTEGSNRLVAVWPNIAGKLENVPLSIISSDPVTDVAILLPKGDLPSPGLQIDPGIAGMAPGDEVWLCGYPMGWEGIQPVLSRGIIAGVDQETWVQVAGTWGHSGGPVAVVRGDSAFVVGQAIAIAGPSSHALNEIDMFKNRQRKIAAVKKLLSSSPAAMLIGEIFDSNASLGERIARLVGSHYRSGFLKLVSATHVQALLDRHTTKPKAPFSGLRVALRRRKRRAKTP